MSSSPPSLPTSSTVVDSRVDTILAVSIFFGVTSFLVIVMRFVSRASIRKKITADDWLVVSALILGLAMSVSLCIGTKLTSRRVRRRCRFAYTFLYEPALALVKTSILVHYQSLFKSYRIAWWFTWVIMIVLNTGAFVLTMLVLFQCKPFRVLLMIHSDPLPPGWKCLDTIRLVYAAAPLQIITDFAVILLPMPILSGLRLPLRQKVMLMFLFGCGGSVTIIQVVRTYYFQKASNDNLYGWNGAFSFMWASVTIYVGIIAASAPMLKPLIARSIPSMGRYCNDWPSVRRPSARRSDTTEVTPSDDVSFAPSHTQTPDNDGNDVTFRRPSSFRSEPDLADYKTTKQSIPMLALICCPFFMWGVSYGLLNVIHKKFEAINNTTEVQVLGMHAAYYGLYFLGPLSFSGWLLRKFGFKITLAAGLFIYGVGCLCFWPCMVQHTYSGIIVSLLVVGFGCGTMELAATAFAILIGPQEYAEVRLNLCQCVQGVGGLIAILIETTVDYASVGTMSYSTFLDIQWVLLACGFIAFILAAIFCCVKLPELKDTTESFAASSSVLFSKGSGPSFLIAIVTLALYVGGQEITTLYSRNILIAALHDKDPTGLKLEKSGQAIFVASRAFFAILLLFVRPRLLLLVCTFSLIGATTLLMVPHHSTLGNAGYLLHLFFEAPVFPTIFATAVRGAGRENIKTASSYLVAAVSGSLILTPIYYTVERLHGPRMAMAVMFGAYVVMLVYPLLLWVSPRERERTRRVALQPLYEGTRPALYEGGQPALHEGTQPVLYEGAQPVLYDAADLRACGACGARRKSLVGVVGFARMDEGGGVREERDEREERVEG